MAIGKRVGFIGSGQMAEALARGLMEKGMITGDMISCSDPTPARKELFKSFGGWGACTPRSQGNEGAWGQGGCKGMQPCTPCWQGMREHEVQGPSNMHAGAAAHREGQGLQGPAHIVHARSALTFDACLQAPTLTNPTLT